ncbi:N-acetylmuramoyl-L-alanine amidase [Actinomadura kijaniata]|uniref:N-acetylmuramoyl-L-alanine amidase n=1 Tax=Actinomadura kijaniata TaxID=46161 RepID=UPI000A4F9340|nr:N-acetylmuramoyl-L-alanine amidase [Actinomadura kijaniata]
MRNHRRRVPLTVGLAFAALGALTACGGGPFDQGDDPQGKSAQPPRATGRSAPAAGTGDAPDRDDGALRGRTIVLDPGHNGGNARNPAAINRQVDIGNGRKECDTTGTETKAGYPEHAFTWDVSKRLERLLKERGAKVVLTRPDDTGVGPCINERAEIGNRAGADAALSIHADGASASSHGFHIIEPVAVKGFNAKAVPASQRLGRAIRDGYREGTGVPYSNYRGTEALDPRDDLGGLNLSRVPKVFIECGNMKHAGDAAKLSSAPFRQKIAESLLDGLRRYFS